MTVIERIKASPFLKKWVHWSITPARNPRPRLWIRLFINPFFHKRGIGSVIRRRSRVDVFPWNRFEVGKETTIEDYVTINNGSGHVLLGNRVRVGIGSVLLGPIIMKDGSGLGQNVFIAGFSHGYLDGEKNSSLQPLVIKQTVIEEEAHIGANAVVLPGITIGKRSQIGAGSVVTRDIPAFSIAVGNPARVIKQYDSTNGKWIKVNSNE